MVKLFINYHFSVPPKAGRPTKLPESAGHHPVPRPRISRSPCPKCVFGSQVMAAQPGQHLLVGHWEPLICSRPGSETWSSARVCRSPSIRELDPTGFPFYMFYWSNITTISMNASLFLSKKWDSILAWFKHLWNIYWMSGKVNELKVAWQTLLNAFLTSGFIIFLIFLYCQSTSPTKENNSFLKPRLELRIPGFSTWCLLLYRFIITHFWSNKQICFNVCEWQWRGFKETGTAYVIFQSYRNSCCLYLRFEDQNHVLSLWMLLVPMKVFHLRPGYWNSHEQTLCNLCIYITRV